PTANDTDPDLTDPTPQSILNNAPRWSHPRGNPGGPIAVANDMCRNCHKLIDAFENLEIYSVDSLVEIKRRHEEAGVAAGAIDASSQVITALQWTVAVYEAGATHMDFRNAVFKVGGEGGHPLGGGG
ncbi:hypothetical protein, partial [Gordonia amicalis]